MTDEIIFYTNPMSRGRTVRWMLEEIGAPYRTEVLEFGTTMKRRAVTGAGYIAGERFSAADVYCGSHIGMGLRFGSLENRTAFSEYWRRVSDRDAYPRATALDDALMPK